MVDNIRQLTLKFKYIDKNFIYIIHTPLMLGLFTVHNKLFNLAKRALLKLWVNGNSISVDYVNIANKGGYIHLKIIFTRMSTATLVQKFKLCFNNSPHGNVPFLYPLKTTFRRYNISVKLVTPETIKKPLISTAPRNVRKPNVLWGFQGV